jgi:hypothetical protein
MGRQPGGQDIVATMPVPFPDPSVENRRPPDAAEVSALSRGILGVVAPEGGITGMQGVLIHALVSAMTGFAPDLAAEPMNPEAFARVLTYRSLAFRTRIVQMVILSVLVLRPMPLEVVDRVGRFAREAGVDEGMLAVAHEFASGSIGLATLDFERNGYASTWDPGDEATLHLSTHIAGAWDAVDDDPGLAQRWRDLEQLPPETLGRRVADFYRARGFTYPGTPGSAPPLLAQHDWVHVLADYGTTVESELEVFGFIARANDDMRAFSLLAMVVSLFETAYLPTGAGLFEADAGHLSRSGVATRLGDAMRRGARCTGSVDFLRVDWFAFATLPTDEVRRHFGVEEKAPEAVEQGSVGPWEPGGISPFQWDAGQALARSEGRSYDAFGASC